MFREQGGRVRDKDRGSDVIDPRDKAGHPTRGPRMHWGLMAFVRPPPICYILKAVDKGRRVLE